MNEPAKKQYNSEDFSESHFGIRNKQDLVHIFNVLRNKMYTNKPLAVMREYSTNAQDAHIESGQRERPIEVTLPTPQVRQLTIRDYGKGLSEEDIRGVYTMYGASTKRGSTELNGQLGFGSKAAFSYTDEYTIVSYHEGKETVFEAYVDETGLGAITKLSEKDASGQTGIEIRIPVQLADIPSFQTTAHELYKYFAVTPIVKNLPANLKIVPPAYSFSGSTWALRKEARGYNEANVTAIMGNVGYPLSANVLQQSLRNYSNWTKIEPMLRCSLDLRFKVGDLSIAASREALEYDKKTLKAVSDALEAALNEAVAEFQKRIEAAEDLVQAKTLYKTLVTGELAPIAPAVLGQNKGLRWKNQTISDINFMMPSVMFDVTDDNGEEYEENAVHVTSYERSGGTGVRARSTHTGQRIEVNNENKFFVKDTNDKPILRLRQYFQDNEKVRTVYLLEPNDQCSLPTFATAIGVPEKYFNKLSEQKALEGEKKASGPSNAKHQQKVFQFTSAQNISSYADSGYWDTVEIDSSEEYYYVYLDRFIPTFGLTSTGQSSNSVQNRTLNEILNHYQTLTGTNIRDKVIGIKISAAKRVKEHWKPLGTVLKEGIEAHTAQIRNHLINQTKRDAGSGHQIISSLKQHGMQARDRLPATSPMRVFLDEQAALPAASAVNAQFNAYMGLKGCMNIPVPALDSAATEQNNRNSQQVQVLSARYPLFQHLTIPYAYSNSASVQNQHRDFAARVIDYCNAVDRLQPTT